MIIDSLGLPKENGSDDLQDSARLAGLLTTFFNLPVPLKNYVILKGIYTRHPREGNKTPFSRDQALCLFAGLKSQKLEFLVDSKYKPRNDIINPAARGHFKRCAGLKTNLFEDWFMYLEVLFHAYIKPKSESNQLLCMLFIADSKYMLLWLKLNKHWKQSITDYWCGWRKEEDLAMHMINKIKGYL